MMKSQLMSFLASHTASTPADAFVSAFLNHAGLPQTNGNRTEARAHLWEQGLLLLNAPAPTTFAEIPDFGGIVPRTLVGVARSSISGQPL